jgi:two-component system sensor histidine kinase/response regulator
MDEDRNSRQLLTALTASDYSLVKADFEPLAVVESVAEVVRPKAREKNLALMAFVAPEIPPWLRGDAERLQQVLLHLVGNAVKFTERGEVVVRATLEAQTESHSVVRFAIADTGVGWPGPTHMTLLDPAAGRVPVGADAGASEAGLVLSKRLVALMGGQLGVASDAGRGATVWCTIPFERSLTDAGLVPADATGALRVLLVDDNDTHRSILHRYLRYWGVRSDGAATGQEALDRLRQAAASGDPFTLAILDLAMPGMDGFALARAVQRDPALAGLRLILLTAFDERGQGELALQAGFAAYLTKPMQYWRLFDVIQRMAQPEARSA